MLIYVLKVKDSTRYLQLYDLLVESNYQVLPVDSIAFPELDSAKSNYNEAATFAKLGYRLSDSAVSCLLGHRKIYQELLKSGEPWALILEDDVQPVKELATAFKYVPILVNADTPSIVQLFTRGERFVERVPVFKFEGFSLFRFHCLPGQTAAYLINRSAAALAIADRSGTGPADWPFWASKVNFFGISPFLFLEDGVDSRIPIPYMGRAIHWRRLLSIITGIHWIRNKIYFESWDQYKLFMIKPIWLRILWRIKCLFLKHVEKDNELRKL